MFSSAAFIITCWILNISHLKWCISMFQALTLLDLWSTFSSPKELKEFESTTFRHSKTIPLKGLNSRCQIFSYRPNYAGGGSHFYAKFNGKKEDIIRCKNLH